MKPLLALAAVPIGAAAALLIAAATWWYVRRPHDREYAWSEPDDGLLHTWATDDPKLRVHLASDEDAIRAALSGMLRSATAPAAGARLPRVVREPVRPLAAAEADAIVDATAGTWLGPLVRLLLGSGLRLGEACGLDQRDLLLDRGFVRVRRSKTSVRAVPVSEDAVAALRDALAAAPRRGVDEPVFFGPRVNRSGHRDRLRGWSVSHALPKVLEHAGLGHLAPHALRHGAATLMLADGVPMRVIAEQLGHANPALTSRIYAHVIPEQQRRAVESLERRRTTSDGGVR